MTFRPKFLIVLITTTVALGLLASVAVAGVQSGSSYAGNTKHKHYALKLSTTCTTFGCTSSTQVTAQISGGSKSHPIAACPSGKLTLTMKLGSSGKFSGHGTMTAGSHHTKLKYTISGQFHSSGKKVTGKVSAPSACGGGDTFSLNAKQQYGGY